MVSVHRTLLSDAVDVSVCLRTFLLSILLWRIRSFLATQRSGYTFHRPVRQKQCYGFPPLYITKGFLRGDFTALCLLLEIVMISCRFMNAPFCTDVCLEL
ncbi:hypothetical protein Drorol1_Dr00025589 [Drosera rotundifolia]